MTVEATSREVAPPADPGERRSRCTGETAPAGEGMNADYLHTCRALHARVTRIRYGRAQNLERIEDAVAGIRSSRQLTYDDIERIRDSEVWDADAFGYWPPRSEIESILESTEWDFWNLPKRESEAIPSLLRVFRQIEPVSVILRFVAPKHYGILSPPVEKILGIGPFRRHPERYQAYSRSLRTLREARGFKTAADVDMALWTLQLGVLDGLLEPELPNEEYRTLQKGFEQDSQLREVRVGNLTAQIFEDVSWTDLAEALLATNFDLAGRIAGIEFERFVRRLTQAEPDAELWNLVHNELPPVIREIHGDARRSTEIIAYCKEACRTRNKAVHLDPPPAKEKVERLIKAMKEVVRMERAQCRRAKVVDAEPASGGADEFSTMRESFREERTLAELAAEQGVMTPQPMEEMIGAAAELWDDDEDFQRFVKGIREHRIEGRRRVEGNT